jgi:hypothetical protein
VLFPPGFHLPKQHVVEDVIGHRRPKKNHPNKIAPPTAKEPAPAAIGGIPRFPTRDANREQPTATASNFRCAETCRIALRVWTVARWSCVCPETL